MTYLELSEEDATPGPLNDGEEGLIDQRSGFAGGHTFQQATISYPTVLREDVQEAGNLRTKKEPEAMQKLGDSLFPLGLYISNADLGGWPPGH